MRRGRARRAVRRLGSEESGFTLAELLMASFIGLIVIGAATIVFTSAMQSQPRASGRATDIQQARTTMERITRELRQGGAVLTASSSQLAMVTYVKSSTCGGAPSTTSRSCRVTYTCSTSSCTRIESNPDGTAPGASQTVVSGVSGPSVFTYSPSTTDPDYVGVRLSYPAENGEDSITLEDGVGLRNPGTSL